MSVEVGVPHLVSGAPRQLEAERAAPILKAAGIPIARHRLVDDPDAAVRAARELGLPVALKITSPDLIHKSDVGGVVLGLGNESSVRDGFTKLVERSRGLELGSWQILVQEMLPSSDFEYYVGARRDSVFGPVMLVGFGGRLVELFGEPTVGLCPLGPVSAAALVRESPLGVVVDGYRGGEQLDLDAMSAILVSLSDLMTARREIAEVDLNPVVPRPEGGFCAVDARVLTITEYADAPEQRPRSAPPASAVAALFRPRSVVVVGASERDERKAGSRVLRYLRRYRYAGELSVVHPTAKEIQGIRCFRTVADLPYTPDLACIAVPRDGCAALLDQCGSKGVPAAIVFTAGFSEGGDEAGERELVELAQRHGMAVCGPNTVGIVNAAHRLHASFSQSQEASRLTEGGVALVSQSGALGGSLLSQAWARGIGIGRFVSVGNQAALTLADVLRHLIDDPGIEVVCLLLEGVKDGLTLRRALAEARQAGTTVVALKIGTSRVGAEVVRSHTAALAGDAAVYSAVFREGGAVSVQSIAEMLDVTELLERGCRPTGGRVGIVSTSGGACTLLADACDAAGLVVPELPPPTQAVLGERLPDYAAFRNPVDVTGQVTAEPQLLAHALESVAASRAVDAVLLAITVIADPEAEVLARLVAEAALSSEVPVVVVWTIDPELAGSGQAVLRDSGVPVFAEAERAVHALGAVVRNSTRDSGEP